MKLAVENWLQYKDITIVKWTERYKKTEHEKLTIGPTHIVPM